MVESLPQLFGGHRPEFAMIEIYRPAQIENLNAVLQRLMCIRPTPAGPNLSAPTEQKIIARVENSAESRSKIDRVSVV